MVMDTIKYYPGVHTSGKPSNCNSCCCCFCPYWRTDKNQNGMSQVTSHNESQYTKNTSKPLRMRKLTDQKRSWSKRESMATPHLFRRLYEQQVKWWQYGKWCQETSLFVTVCLVSYTSGIDRGFHRLTHDMLEEFYCIQRKWGFVVFFFFTLNSSNWCLVVVGNVLGMPDAHSVLL